MSSMSKKGLSARYKHNNDTKDKGGSFGCFKFPSETKFFKLKEGRNKFIIVPYRVKSKNHPLVASGAMEIGDIDSVMDVFIHRSIGGGETDIICPKKNYSKRCPICELAKEKYDAGKEDDYNALKASRRVFFNVIKADDDDKELLVFSLSHFNFMKPLTEEANEDGDPIDYADPDDGKIISFRANEEAYGKRKFFDCVSFRFEDRDFKISEKMIDQAVSFDEVMKLISAEEIEKILYGGDDDEDEEDDRKSRKRKGDDEDEDESEKRSKKSKSRDEDDEEEDRDDRKSSKESSKKSKKDDEDDEEEKPKKSKKDDDEEKPKNKVKEDCPHGFVFGKDTDRKDECEECKKWDDCDEAKRKSKK